MKKLVLASNNAKKMMELNALLAPLGFEVIPQGQLDIPEAEEPHCTFVENALAKARHAARHSGLPALAWEAGPRRVQEAFAALLERRIARGELEIDDPAMAATHFFTLLKGEPHACALIGVSCCKTLPTPKAHVASVVDLFLRAYARR